ncbi:hypothetical protein NKR19_g1283 [Coniochaeta hoffmannii]|uniref:Uncharacterized protein n=1 Tax=Coniochaeta hoffmannii TaxID=91930 RepID=A0AA38SCL8_9PEZI|nr:hypothetical protein NKR19_g1283 [Coniochaeta hoffmannii]
MATAETVKLGPPHEPKEESIKAFKEVEHELKKQLVHIRHQHDKHEPEYFASVAHLSNADLTSFTEADLTEVRVGTSAYGIHVFGKVRLPAMPDSGPAYIHIRMYSAGPGEEAKLHCIHTEEKEEAGGGFKYRAVFTKDDPLEWFDT